MYGKDIALRLRALIPNFDPLLSMVELEEDGDGYKINQWPFAFTQPTEQEAAAVEVWNIGKPANAAWPMFVQRLEDTGEWPYSGAIHDPQANAIYFSSLCDATQKAALQTTLSAFNPPASAPAVGQPYAPSVADMELIDGPKVSGARTLNQTDAKMARVAEDVIDALVAKGTIATTDLPTSVQTLLNERKAARNKLK